ncbi:MULTISPECIES: hypothetical protein [Klebsiella]|uniref:hypothetical protein n=1 Tax=Klebsiella TaxID=570 RepID=UPI001257BA92|nr:MULTISPECIES: hypothetical protein [Klebsiella]NRG21794.1 hypothetical protein [Klebsiella michiganensis]VAN44422.1 Uncharacterised protein [Klebsiella quasivariicola]
MLMSKAEYARHRGVSRQTVYDWVAKGEVVVSGTKIDVEATERSLQKEEQTPDERHPRVLKMTWGQFWAAVKALDGKSPAPRTEDEIKQRVLHATRELNWTVEFIEDGGIYMCDGDTEFYLTTYNQLIQNADIAIRLIRCDVCYTASECPNDEDEWSKEGMAALAEWAS